MTNKTEKNIYIHNARSETFFLLWYPLGSPKTIALLFCTTNSKAGNDSFTSAQSKSEMTTQTRTSTSPNKKNLV
jgi:hypothetical protein